MATRYTRAAQVDEAVDRVIKDVYTAWSRYPEPLTWPGSLEKSIRIALRKAQLLRKVD